MNAQLQQIVDSVPEDKPRSRLEPYRALILQWRRQGRSYRRIRELVADNCNVVVSANMIHKFVRSRSRPRKVEPEAEITPEHVEQQANKPKLSHEERVARRNAIRAAHTNPPTSDEKPPYRFEFDESKPITNKHYEGKKNGSSTANS